MHMERVFVHGSPLHCTLCTVSCGLFYNAPVNQATVRLSLTCPQGLKHCSAHCQHNST